jgi:hypothetical protein
VTAGKMEIRLEKLHLISDDFDLEVNFTQTFMPIQTFKTNMVN